MNAKPSLNTLALVVVSAGVGALAACLLLPDRPPAAPAAAARPQAKAAKDISEAPNALERALRKRIRQLEGELAAARAPKAEDGERAKPEVRPVEREDGDETRPRTMRERMEEFRKKNPERYEEMKRHRAEHRTRQLAHTKDRLAFFSSLDTSGMSEAERKNHEKLQDLLVQRENLPEISENMTDEEMREAGRQRRELDQTIRRANATERTALIKQTAGALGLEEADANLLTETVQEVIRATDSGFGPPPPPGGGHP